MVAKSPTKALRIDAGSYISLVRRFPLRPLKNDQEHKQATEIVSELLGYELDAGAGDYLETLIILVNKYEDERHTVSNEFTPQQAVRAIMEANGMNQKDIGKLIGSESAVSMFLKAGRQLSKLQIKRLAERFRIDPLLFL